MVSLIKNQIFKHLSRFTKNLSPDKINVSTFKGEGELTSLELDEIVLTDLLELPLWLRLTSAWCNKVSFRVQWTKLKTVPIFISLDEVFVQIETCEELRSMSVHQGLSSYGTTTKYNFINKVIDGMTISVNTVKITFKSPAFTAIVQIMRILVESKSPEWQRVDLTMTRLKDTTKGQVLIFKELEWQTLRLEASSTKDVNLPPLRLLTNKAKCRITIKKRISDCFVMGCKLLLILEDLLWVLTDSQLKAVLHFIESLSGLVQKATEVTRTKKAARKLEVLPEYQAQLAQQARATELNTREQIFATCDVIETSYHFWAKKIDLHLSDDAGDGRSCHPLLSKGSAVHMQVRNLQVDCYPYHLAAGDRFHWARYNHMSSPHTQWLAASQAAFKTSLLQLLETNKHRGCVIPDQDEGGSERKKHGLSPPGNNQVKKYVLSQLAKVMTSCIVLRVEDFIVNRVTTNNKQSPKEFIKGQHRRRESLTQVDSDRHITPLEVTLHAEFTYYYYPGDIPFPLPPPKFYVMINPVQVNFDVSTLLWMNSFALNLHQSFLKTKKDPTSTSYIDVKIEAIMPRIVFESSSEVQYGQRDRPKSLHIQVSRALISNVRSADSCSRADLAKCIHASQLGSLFYSTEFPSKAGDFNVVTEKFIKHVQCEDSMHTPVQQLLVSSVDELISSLSKTLLWTEARDVWCINLEPLWGDFYGARGVAHNRPVPFLDAFPLKIWVHLNSPSPEADLVNKGPDIHAVAYISSLISFQLNHYQLLFLLRLADEFTELVTILGIDSERISDGKKGSFVLGAVIPQLEVTLVMPSQTHGKESSGADIESVIPDTSSLADDVVTNPSIQWNTVVSTNIIQDSVPFRKGTIFSTTSPPSDQLSMELGSPSKPKFVKQNINSVIGLQSVKKGFSNISNMFESVLKPPDDNVDSFSIKSEGSSDSDNYVARLSGHSNDAMFSEEGCEPNFGVEIASEVLEDEDNQSGATLSMTTPSENQSNASSYRRKDMISIATFKLGQVEVIQQSEGLKSDIKMHVSNIAIDECPAIPWDEFQNKFSTRSRGWSEVCEQPTERPRIRLRVEHSVQVGDLKSWQGPNNSTWFNDLLIVSITNINLKINSATLAAIADFLVDDVISPPLPMEINLENIELNLVEERMSGGGTPLNVSVARLHISRNKEGIVLIEPYMPYECNINLNELSDLRAENEQLRRRLAAMERLTEENHYLRKCEEETHVLRSCLNEAQDSMNKLLQEKQSLLELLKTQQVSKTENKVQHSGKR